MGSRGWAGAGAGLWACGTAGAARGLAWTGAVCAIAWAGSNAMADARLSARTSLNLFTSTIPRCFVGGYAWVTTVFCPTKVIHGMNGALQWLSTPHCMIDATQTKS
jgi:hypothetical protein